MQQKRLLLALLLSVAILGAWTIFFPPTQQKLNPTATPSPSASSTPAQTASATPQPASQSPASVPAVAAAAKRIVTIRTPLYETKFDTLGAEPISWIIKQNKISGNPIYSVAGKKSD